MNSEPYERLETEGRRIIGTDHVYLNAKDSQRHFDPIIAVDGYVATLFIVFVTAASTKLGEGVGKALYHRLVSIVANISTPKPKDDAAQIEKIKTVDQALSLIANKLSKQYLDEFIESGRRRIEDKLIADNFPPAKAKRISSEFAKLVEGRIQSGKTT
jgi:hypothetical protein